MTREEFVSEYHSFVDKICYNTKQLDDKVFSRLYDIILYSYGDIPSDFFSGRINMARGYLLNLDKILEHYSSYKPRSKNEKVSFLIN